jgi:hypothetical protein
LADFLCSARQKTVGILAALQGFFQALRAAYGGCAWGRSNTAGRKKTCQGGVPGDFE